MSDTSPTTSGDGSTPTNPVDEPTTAPGSAGGPATPARSSSPEKAEDPLRGSRTSGIWVGVISLGLVLILLIIFIAQNTDDVDVAFLGWEGRAPLSVTLLIAAAAGLFLAGIAGMLRILQLRRRVRRGERA